MRLKTCQRLLYASIVLPYLPRQHALKKSSLSSSWYIMANWLPSRSDWNLQRNSVPPTGATVKLPIRWSPNWEGAQPLASPLKKTRSWKEGWCETSEDEVHYLCLNCGHCNDFQQTLIKQNERSRIGEERPGWDNKIRRGSSNVNKTKKEGKGLRGKEKIFDWRTWAALNSRTQKRLSIK